MTKINIRMHTPHLNIDPVFFDRLNTLANQFGIYVEENNIVVNEEESYQKRKHQIDEFIRKADALAEGMAPQTIDSTDLIREDRERL